MAYSDINWQEIYSKINLAIAKLENFQGPGKSYHLSPEAVEEVVEILQELRRMLPATSRQDFLRNPVD